MRDLIILAGGYRLDTMSASAIRALGLAQMIQGLGYRVIILGKFHQAFADAREPEGRQVNGVTCRDIEQPVAGRPSASYIHSAEPLMQVVNEQGADRVKAIILYNYPARGAWSTLRESRRRGIATILDCTEWYGREGRKVLRNVWRLAGVETRMRLLTRLAGNVICASRWFRDKVARQHTVLLPFVLDTSRGEWQRGSAPDPTETVHLVYSGSSGLGMYKDRLPVMIEALARLASKDYDFRLSIAGMTEGQYLETVLSDRGQVAALGKKLRFLGRIPHEESLALLRTADFSVFFRKPNRVSNTGFATKFVEAATLGVPVVSNPTSDIPLYLRDGENGILAQSFGEADVEEALRRAISLSPESRATMVAACRAENPFDLRLWHDAAKSFFDNLRGEMSKRPIRVLWTSNIDLPAVAPDLGLKPTPFGAWLTLMTSRLAQQPEFEIGIAMRSESRVFRRVNKDGIAYFALPRQRDRFDVSQADVDRVLAEFQPDILHVEGAEMRHARRFLANFAGPRLLSMQGVLNGYASYELGRLPIARMLNPLRPRIMLTALALLVQRLRSFVPRLESERKAMRLASHIVGRTLWDRAQASALAPDASYHHCSRILRDEFYTRRWSPDSIDPFSIFMGNGASARKGAHIAVQGLSLLVRDFPQATICIAGEDPRSLPLRSVKRHVGYPVYLLHLIRELGLEDRVHFTGILSEQQMAERMARSHVCLMASIIENSPNTLGEAMILGVPTVSAYAGGAPSMASDEVEALFYRPDDPVMLALQVRRIFTDTAMADRLSRAARARALKTHNPQRNLADLVAVYHSIVAEETDSHE